MKVDQSSSGSCPRRSGSTSSSPRTPQNLVKAARPLRRDRAEPPASRSGGSRWSQLKALEHDGDQITRADLRRPQLHLHHALRPRGHPLARHRPRRHPRLPGRRGPVPGPLRAGRVARSRCASSPRSSWRWPRRSTAPPAWSGTWRNEKQIQRGHRAHLRAREPGRRPLQHGDRRPVQGRTGANPIEIMKWKEIYEGLEDACDAVQGLHPHPRQRRRQERLRPRRRCPPTPPFSSSSSSSPSSSTS